MKTVVQEKSIGKQLSEAREAKGWTLEEAARRTKLKRDALALIEADAFEKLPSFSYARGFIRIYARELGLDGWSLLKKLSGGVTDESLDMLELHPDDLEAIPRRTQPPLATTQGVGLFFVLGILAIAFVIGGLKLYEIWPDLFAEKKEVAPTPVSVVEAVEQPPEIKPAVLVEPPAIPRAQPVESETVEKEPVAKPIPAAIPIAQPIEDAAAVAEAVTGTHQLQLIGNAAASETDRWVRVVGVRGGKEVVLFENILPAGQTAPGLEQPWVADSFIITFRESSAVDVIFNGVNHGPYPKAGPQKVPIPGE
jgi:cytoskeletal protein RodZ